MRGPRMYLGIPVLVCCLLLLAGCQTNGGRETTSQPEPAPTPSMEEETYWTVHTVGDGSDPGCPCCPVGDQDNKVLTDDGEPIPCCPCDYLLSSPDQHEWKTMREENTEDGVTRSEFFFCTSALPDPGCPCCPIVHMYLQKRDSIPCCPCDIYTVGGTHMTRQWSPMALSSDLHELITSRVVCPDRGRLFVTATCEVQRDAASEGPLSVELGLQAEFEARDEAPQSYDVASGATDAVSAQLLVVRTEYKVDAGEAVFSLVGKADAAAAGDRILTRSINTVFVPDPDAGPLQ